MTSKSIVIIGGSYYGNRGATLMLKNSINKIREMVDCNISFDVWTENIKENKILCDDIGINLIEFVPWKFALILLPKLIIQLIFKKIGKNHSYKTIIGSCYKADLFYDISGVSFMDERKPLFLFYDALILLPAIILKIPIIKAAQAFGPFKKPLNRLLAKLILPRINHIYARGDESMLNLREMGLTNISLSGDIGFCMLTQNSFQKSQLFNNIRRPIIGISVSSVVYIKCKRIKINYLKLMNEFINYIIDNKKGSIILIPNAVKYKDDIRNNDVPIIKRILETSKSKNVHYFENIEHPFQLRQLISICDALIASRFHAMVTSLSVGVPVVVIGWSHKYQEVLKMFDLNGFYIPFKDLTFKNMIDLFKNMFLQRTILINRINNHRDEVTKLADKNYELIPRLLKENTK